MCPGLPLQIPHASIALKASSTAVCMPFLYQGRLLHCWFVKDWYDGSTFNHTLLLKHHQSHTVQHRNCGLLMIHDRSSAT
jgi:hypothetical protein